jgi:hypothetical protein
VESKKEPTDWERQTKWEVTEWERKEQQQIRSWKKMNAGNEKRMHKYRQRNKLETEQS